MAGAEGYNSLKTDYGAGNDKQFTVPAGQLWRVMSVSVRLVATGTGAARQIMLEVIESAIIRTRFAGAVVAAGDTRYLSFGGSQRDTVAQVTTFNFPMPNIVLEPADILKVYDFNAEDVLDVLDVRVSVEIELF